jgi:hypothetical protein
MEDPKLIVVDNSGEPRWPAEEFERRTDRLELGRERRARPGNARPATITAQLAANAFLHKIKAEGSATVKSSMWGLER